MEALIGTIIGALLAGGAMVLNTWINARYEREREERLQRRRLLEKQLDELAKLYEEALHISERLSRNKGRDSEQQLEKFYRLDVQLRLHSTEEIREAFVSLTSSVVTMASNLPDLPEEFIPNFEDDSQRQQRLRRRREAERERDEKAREYQPECYNDHRRLAHLMRQDLSARRALEKKGSEAGQSRAEPDTTSQ